MKIDRTSYWTLIIPVLTGFGLPVLLVHLLGLERNAHQENAFFALFITLAVLMYGFYKQPFREKYPEQFERISGSLPHVAMALFFSSLSASTVATAISLIPAPDWFHITLYVVPPALLLYVLFKRDFKL